MSVLEKIAFHSGRRDEVPNQELARKLAARKDAEGIAEIAANLANRNRSIASDCLKVLYEIGYIDPALIAPYMEDLLAHLASCNPRDVPTHLESMMELAESGDRDAFLSVVESRKKEMTPSHLTRLRKATKRLEKPRT